MVDPKRLFPTLKDSQLDIVTQAAKHDKGLFVKPTGTGKSYTEFAIMVYDILLRNKEFGIYVFNIPKIVLSYQMLKEMYEYFINYDIDAYYMFVHSGYENVSKDMDDIRIRMNSNVEYYDIRSGTSSDDIAIQIQDGFRDNRPVIFISTYHSAERINIALGPTNQKIRMIINDEAHNLTSLKHHRVISELLSERLYNFTATALYGKSLEGRGMNNHEKYGKLLYKMLPIEAIEKGLIIRPKCKYLMVDYSYKYNINDYDCSYEMVIDEAYKHHTVDLKILPKLLIAAKGTTQINNFINSETCDRYRADGVNILAIASDKSVGNYINGERYGRSEFLKRMKSICTNPDERCIILNYEILTEGIDVPGITGFLPLREMPRYVFLQFIGRVVRLNGIDRKMLNSGELRPDQHELMNKPYAWVILPNITSDTEDMVSIYESIVESYNSYDFDVWEEGDLDTDALGKSDEVDATQQNINNEMIEIVGNPIDPERIYSDYSRKKNLSEMYDKSIMTIADDIINMSAHDE